VIAVGHVDRVVLARSHVECERLAVIGLLRVVGPAVMGDHVLEIRVRASGEVGRVRKGEDVLDLAQGKSVILSKARSEQMLPELFEEMTPA